MNRSRAWIRRAALALGDDVAALRQRHGRLAGRIAAMPAFDASVRDLTGLAAQARTLIAPIERLNHPQADTAAAYARQLAAPARERRTVTMLGSRARSSMTCARPRRDWRRR